MNPDQTTLKIITSWITRLADVTSHSDGKPSKDTIATYATVLGQTYPSAAFNVESMAFASGRLEWFPPVSVAAKLINEWWNDHKPRSAPAIAATGAHAKPAGWEDMDTNWLNFWHKRDGEIGDLDDRDAQHFKRSRLQSLVRQQSFRAAQWLGFTPKPENPVSAEEAAEIIARHRVRSIPKPPAQPPRQLMPEAPFRLPLSSVMLPEHLAKARELAGVRLP